MGKLIPPLKFDITSLKSMRLPLVERFAIDHYSCI